MSKDRTYLNPIFITAILVSFVIVLSFNPIGALTQTNNYDNGAGTGFNGNIWLERFTGLGSGSTINQFSLNVSASGKAVNQNHTWTGSVADPRGSVYAEKFTNLPVGANITAVSVWQNNVGTTFDRVKIYKDDGVGYHQGTLINNYKATHGDISGAVYAEKFTNLLVGGQITQINFWTGSCGAGFYDVRVKVYQDDGTGGNPSTLLGEGVGTGGCGPALVGVPVSATVPASGNVWAAIECKINTKACDLGVSTGLASGTSVAVSHTFGVGPNPFGTPIAQTTAPYLELMADDYTIAGYPSTLLGESSSIQQSIGQFGQIPVTATVPASGNVWAAYEVIAGTGTPSYQFLNAPPAPNSAINVGHVYGTGPSPFGRASNATAYAMQLVWNQGSQVRAKIYQDNGVVAVHSQTHSYTGSEITSGGNGLSIQKFSGLPVGGKITALEEMSYTGNNWGNGRTKIFDNTGTLVGINETLHNTDTNQITSGGSGIYLQEFTGLQAGKPITGLGVFTFGGGTNINCCADLKVYDDDGSGIVHLLGDTGPISTSNISYQAFKTTVLVPANGKIWTGFEGNYSTAYAGFGYGVASMEDCGHSFGSGPSTIDFSTCSNPNLHLMSAVWVNGQNATFAGNLIGESGQIAPSSSGAHTYSSFPVNATIPNDGVVWAGNEFQTTNNMEFHPSISNTQFSISHTFGSGPNLVNATTIFNDVGFAYAYKLDYSSIGGAGTLLGETSPVTVTHSGKNNFPLTVTVPTSGNIWAGFETNDTNYGLRELTGAMTGIIYSYSHSFGSGPNPISGDQNSTTPVWMQVSYTNAANVSFRPMLHDNQTQLTSSKVYAIQNGVTIASANANLTGWANLGVLTQGNYNITVMDDKNFASLKLINFNVGGTIAKKLATNDYPINCIGPFTGYQSDFILRINDTAGTHVSNVSTPDCSSRTDIIFSETFTGNGQSGNAFSSSMLTSIGNSEYQINAQRFTVNGNNVTTSFQGNTNLISNSFVVGTGLTSETLNFDITLGQVTQVVPPPSGPANPNPNPPPVTCTDPLGCAGNSCQYGINPDGSCFDPTCLEGENCNHLQCPPNSTLYNNECLAIQPQVCPDGSQPVNGVCNTGNPSCPSNTILVNGQCVVVQIQLCPDGTAPINGMCPSGPLQCSAGTTLLNGECVKVQPPNTCLLGVNPDGSCITSYQQDQCTANPLLCLLGAGGGAGKITVSGITYTPTVDIVQLGQIKNEVIGVSWDSSSNLVLAGLYFGTNSSFGFNPTPTAPYNITGSAISQSSSGQIKYVLTVPSNFCSQTITTNCLDSRISTFAVPVSITAILDGKEVRNTIFLKITVLTQQTIATYLIAGIAMFALFAILLSRRKDNSKKKARRNVQVRSYKNNRQYLSKR